MVAAVSRSITISAPRDVIFAILADPRQHVLIDGSGTVKGTLSPPDRLALGTRFGMRMRLGIPYRIRNEVVEFEEGRLIAWRHFVRHVWRYELESRDAGPDGAASTVVTETFDPATARAQWVISLLKFPQRNAVGIERTLERLKKTAESRA